MSEKPVFKDQNKSQSGNSKHDRYCHVASADECKKKRKSESKTAL